jgi:alpha-L-rhamnosidase
VNAWNYDVANMYRKWQYDHNDICHENGYVPPVVPSRFDGPTINGPWWGGMIVYNVAKLYEYYHDTAIISDSYEPMKRYIGYLGSIANNNVVEWGLGEWMEPFRANMNDARPTTTPVPLTSTVAYYHFTQTMRFFAEMLGKPEDVMYFSKLAAAIKDSYNKRFFNEQTGVYAQGSQAGQLLSLKYGLVPEGKQQLAIDRLKDFIAARDGYLSTGFVGTPILLTTLSDLGLSKEAYIMATKEGYPGWFDMVFKKGNSVMKENWEGGLVQMPSLAGPIGHWFFYSLAGIRNVPGKPAFEEVIIKPDVLDNLTWASGTFQSPRGTIVSKWKKQADNYELQVTIPANTSAQVYLPTTDAAAIRESGKPITGKDIRIEKTEQNNTILRIGSGTYHFSIKKASE